MKRRVVVTGLGCVTPIGRCVPAFRDALYAGVSGVGPITLFEPGTLPTRIAAEVKGPVEAPFGDRKIGFALAAAKEAIDDASRNGTRPGGAEGGAGAGVSLGLGLELFSMEDLLRYEESGYELPPSVTERLSFLQTPADLCLHAVAYQHALQAPPQSHVSACAAGADAIGAAFHQVATGRRRWMLAGGADSMINLLGLGGFCKLGATSTNNQEPTRASRPFDRTRSGFVLGEGAGLLVLESLEDAQRRGAPIHAELLGYGCSFDAHGISEPHPEGRGALQAMRRALADAGLRPEDVDAVNAHGTSTPKNDVIETLALKRLFGERARQVPVVSTKSMIGHLISAAGAVETIAAVLGLQAQRLHPTLNLDEPDPQCDLDYVPHTARDFPHRVVLKTSFAFGGQNAALVLRRFEGA